MSKYRKKPVTVEAFRWTGGPDQVEDPEWIVETLKKSIGHINGAKIINKGTKDFRMQIMTLEGIISARVGDYIIKGIKNELYPCKPDIFEVSYDLVS